MKPAGGILKDLGFAVGIRWQALRWAELAGATVKDCLMTLLHVMSHLQHGHCNQVSTLLIKSHTFGKVIYGVLR